MRLIDADAHADEIAVLLERIEDAIAEAPTIDAVEVVRCKDCKWLKKWDDGEQTCKRIGVGYIVGDDDYCSRSKRREP